MLVEDDLLSQEALALVLAAHGAVVDCAAAAPQAIARLEHAAPHVIISDIGLPGVDGYDLIRRVRHREAARGERIAALAISGFCDVGTRRAQAAGFDAFLSKPVDIETLVARVRRLVGA